MRASVGRKATDTLTARAHRGPGSVAAWARGCNMLSPYGLDIIESCMTCKVRAERLFCDISGPALQAFEQIKYATAYPKGAVLFV